MILRAGVGVVVLVAVVVPAFESNLEGREGRPAPFRPYRMSSVECVGSKAVGDVPGSLWCPPAPGFRGSSLLYRGSTRVSVVADACTGRTAITVRDAASNPGGSSEINLGFMRVALSPEPLSPEPSLRVFEDLASRYAYAPDLRLMRSPLQWLQDNRAAQASVYHQQHREVEEVCGCSCMRPKLSAACWLSRLFNKVLFF